VYAIDCAGAGAGESECEVRTVVKRQSAVDNRESAIERLYL
jgi:hypothetical protein